MKTLLLTAQKGGVGKSTLTSHLAVEFMRDGANVAILDLDRQGSLAFWANVREALQPEVISASFGEFDIWQQRCKAAGKDFLLVDTPPHAGAGIQLIVQKADLALVPLRPGPFDLSALEATVAFLDPSKSLVIMNQVPSVGTEAKEMRDLITEDFPSFRVAQSQLGHRKAFSHALIAGMSVSEFDRENTKAVQEVRSLHAEIKELLK